MSQTRFPLISLIVPTLNRGRHVLRAIQSCLDLDLQTVPADVQVIVSDAGSTDGSWEAIQQRFGNDSRVTLLQSPPGSGPMENWLNGARHVTGDYVTFVWSDDYIAPHFISLLLPPLQSGAMLAVGRGAQRDVDDDTPLTQRRGEARISKLVFLSGYMMRGTHDGVDRPFSPTCSLFRRDAFDAWIANAHDWIGDDALRREVMWKRGIGPDQLLYLTALALGGPVVPVVSSDVAQFSRHAGSITYFSSRLPFEVGYWVSAVWYVVEAQPAVALSNREFLRFASALFVYGGLLWLLTYMRSARGGVQNPDRLPAQLCQIAASAVRRGVRVRFWMNVLAACVTTPARLLCHLTKGVRKTVADNS